jgi:hypothetical protein
MTTIFLKIFVFMRRLVEAICLLSWHLLFHFVHLPARAHCEYYFIISGRNCKYVVRFQVLTATSMKMIVFWGITSCRFLEVYRRFRGAYCLHHKQSTSTRLHCHVLVCVLRITLNGITYIAWTLKPTLTITMKLKAKRRLECIEHSCCFNFSKE